MGNLFPGFKWNKWKPGEVRMSEEPVHLLSCASSLGSVHSASYPAVFRGWWGTESVRSCKSSSAEADLHRWRSARKMLLCCQSMGSWGLLCLARSWNNNVFVRRLSDKLRHTMKALSRTGLSVVVLISTVQWEWYRRCDWSLVYNCLWSWVRFSEVRLTAWRNSGVQISRSKHSLVRWVVCSSKFPLWGDKHSSILLLMGQDFILEVLNNFL